MLLNAIRSGALFAALSTATTLDAAIARRGGYSDICPAGVTEVTVTHKVNCYPVAISTQCDHNTIIIINGGITINVNNAPTLLVTTVTATVTEPVTVTAAATATPFVLALVANTGTKAKRQAGALYLQTDGSTTTDCLAADSYEIASGHLFGEGKIYAAPPNARTAVFANSNKGNVTTTFVITPDLAWSNSAFGNTNVVFCSIAGIVNAIFSGPTPSGCDGLTLKSVPVTASDCAATKKMKKRGARPIRMKARGNFPRF